jgi:outer membrane protein OmpA-like peptidoglycan-associated protein
MAVGLFLEDKGIKQVRTFGRGEEVLLRDQWGRELKDKSRRVVICF